MDSKKIAMLLVTAVSLTILAFLPNKMLFWQAKNLEIMQENNEYRVEMLELDIVSNPHLPEIKFQHKLTQIKVDKVVKEINGLSWFNTIIKWPIYYKNGMELKRHISKIEDQLLEISDP